jgi:hypothetical protein
MANQSKFAVVEQDSPGRPPLLTAGDLTPTVMRSFEMACFGYFEHKDIAEDKQVRKILAGLQDNRIQDWLSVERDRFLDLTFVEFMKEFRAAYLPQDWQDITRIELLAMTQGDSSFWDFAIQIQAKNSLLRNTESHLSKHDLRHRIESGMTQKLALRCRLEKCNDAIGLEQWLIEVKRVDDLLRMERADFEALAKVAREAGRRNNPLGEPSRRANTAPSSSSSARISLPKLTQTERKLIYDNEGCLKCRHVFVNHQSGTCPNDFPDASTYKPLTQATVDAIGKRAKKSIAAVMPPTAEATTSAQPVAVVMGVSTNPIAYMPSNVSNVIEGDSFESEPSVSTTAIAPSPESFQSFRDAQGVKR